MKKINTEISVGEIIDKITILEIKKKMFSRNKDLIQINKEHKILVSTLKKNIKIDKKIKKLWRDLFQTNLKIWKMENFKRESQKILEKLTQTAKDVYRSNDDRANIKLKLNKITGSNLREVKKYSKY